MHMEASYAAKESSPDWELETKDEPGAVDATLWNTLDNGLDTRDVDQDKNAVDSVRVYLQEISRIPLLSAEEEIWLAQRMGWGK